MTPKPKLSPETVARLRDAHERLGHARSLRATLDRWHDRLAAENPAVTATEAGEAWFQCYARTGVCLDVTRRELDQLLDGDEEGADQSRRFYFIAGNALEPCIDAFSGALDRR